MKYRNVWVICHHYCFEQIGLSSIAQNKCTNVRSTFVEIENCVRKYSNPKWTILPPFTTNETAPRGRRGNAQKGRKLIKRRWAKRIWTPAANSKLFLHIKRTGTVWMYFKICCLTWERFWLPGATSASLGFHSILFIRRNQWCRWLCDVLRYFVVTFSIVPKE